MICEIPRPRVVSMSCTHAAVCTSGVTSPLTRVLRGDYFVCMNCLQSLEEALDHLELEKADDDSDGSGDEGVTSPGGTVRRGLWGVLNFDGDA